MSSSPRLLLVPTAILRSAWVALLLPGFALFADPSPQIILSPANVIGGSPWITGNGGTTSDWNSVDASGFQASTIFSQQTGPVTGAAGSYFGNTWFPSGDIGGTGASLDNRFVTIDLGAAYVLSSFEIFNTNTAQRITGTFDILASNSITSAPDEGGFARGQFLSSPTTLLGSTALSFTNVEDPITGQTFSVNSSTAYRYVQIDLLTATGFNTGSGVQIFGSGLSEVRIYGTSAIPEPSTFAILAGSAVLGLAMWNRRRAKPASA